MTNYSGVTWRVNYGEISERNQFRVGRVGMESYDAYFEVGSLVDLISVLNTVNGLGLGQVARGTTVQARKVSDGLVTAIRIEPRLDSGFPERIMVLPLADLSDFLYALGLFQTDLPSFPIADDWDFSKLLPVVFLDKTGKLQESAIPDRLSQTSLDNAFVNVTGNESVAGVKTFSSAPVVPDASFGIPAINGLQGALDGLTERTIDVQKHGIVPDGTDQTTALNALISTITSPCEFVFSPSAFGASATTYRIDGTVLIHNTISLRAEKVRVEFGDAGCIKYGNGTARLVANATVTGFRFYRSGSARSNIVTGQRFIKIDRVRDLTIFDNQFQGSEECIEIVNNAAGAFHDNGIIKIVKNRFAECDYSFTGRSTSWDKINDIEYSQNVTNVAYKSSVYLPNGTDGIHIVGNIEFTLHYDYSTTSIFALKQQNYYIGRSSQVMIAHNNLFEAGLEAIKLVDASIVNITANNITWSGQVNLSDAISVTFAPDTGYWGRAAIGLNMIDGWTKNAIGVYGQTGSISGLETNVCQWKTLPQARPATGWDTSSGVVNDVAFYQGERAGIGNAPLVAANCGRYYLDVTMGNRYIIPAISASPRDGERDTYGGHPGASHIQVMGRFMQTVVIDQISPASFGSGGSSALVKLCDVLRQTSIYGGEVLVIATRGTLSSIRKAQYKLAVSKSAVDGRECVLLWSNGPDSGATSGDPSFSFSINTNEELVATSMGANVTGSFNFWVMLTGNLDVQP